MDENANKNQDNVENNSQEAHTPLSQNEHEITAKESEAALAKESEATSVEESVTPPVEVSNVAPAQESAAEPVEAAEMPKEEAPTVEQVAEKEADREADREAAARERAEKKKAEAAASEAKREEKRQARQKKKAEKLKKQAERDEKLKEKLKNRRPRRKHYIYRVVGALLRFTLTLVLGMAIAYGSVIGAVYHVVSGLTIDELQKFGIATDADKYLTQNGDIDLTSTSLLELIADLNAVRADLGEHTLQTLIDHYGIALPAETLAVLPTDLFSVPITTLVSSEGGAVIAQNLKFGYLLSFLPPAMLSPRVVETLSERPLALLTNGQYGELFAGVKLGYFTGVTFDEEGNVVPVNASQLTMQEAMAELDLGRILSATTQNGDLLGVLATDLGEQELRPILSGFMTGALLEKMCEGRLVKDVILPDANTGRYTFSLPALCTGVYLGDALGYIKVGDTWYTAYTDNGDDTDDVPASSMNAALAKISLLDVINRTLSLDQTFDGMYFGDLQNGYSRGDAITEPNPEGGEDIVVGYCWMKDGAKVSKMQAKIANMAVSDVLNGHLDLNATLGSLYIGDLQGYTYREVLEGDTLVGHKWMKKGTDNTETEVSPVLSAIADISLSTVLNGQLDMTEALGALTLGEVQGYTRGEDLRWYRTVTEGDESTLVYVGAVQNALANVLLSDVMSGQFSLSSALGELRMGDAMGYTRGDIYESKDPSDEASYDKYEFTKGETPPVEVTGTMLEIANLPLSDVLEGRADFSDTVKDMRLGEVLEYTEHEGVWYSTFVAANSDENVRVKGVLGVLAGNRVKELNESTINAIAVGEVLGYTEKDTDADGTPDKWYDENNKRVTGMLATLADITIGEFSNADTLTAKIRELALADAMGYTLVDGVWYSEYSDDGDSTNDVKLTGILAALATNPLKDINTATIDAILLGDAIGYMKKDTNGDGAADTWYQDDVPATGIMGTMADLTVGALKDSAAVSEKLGEVELSVVLNYKYVDGQWVNKNNVAASGVMAHLMGLKINAVEHEIDEMPLGYAFGFYRNEETGEWFTDQALSKKPTGITASLANIHLTHAREELNSMKLGRLLGHSFNEGAWEDANGKPLTGLDLVFADMLVSDLDNADKIAGALQTAKLGDSMGYKCVEGVWYKTKTDAAGNTVADEEKPVTGLLGALADTEIGGVENKLKSISIGTMLDFTKKADGWYDSGNNKVTGVLAVLAGSDLDHIVGDIENMTVAQLYPEPEGILKAIDPTTKVTELDTAMMNCKIKSLMDAELLNISVEKQAIFATALGADWASKYTIIDFLNYLINGTIPSQS